MAAMAKVDVEDPYESGLKGHGVECDTLTGAGVTSTTVRAAVSSAQLYICGGRFTAEGAAVLKIYSDTTQIDQVELVAAGSIDLPHCWTAAGAALKFENTDAATVFIRCESRPVTDGQAAQQIY